VDDLARSLAIVGHKWTLLIVQELLAGPRRFTEIERALDGANPKMVTARLRELEASGLVSRTIYAEVPPRVEYALTDRGRELRQAIAALQRWGTRLPRRTRMYVADAPRHEISARTLNRRSHHPSAL
jgi:DNA-binding HxlR family transcriptional regulator